MEEEYTYKNYNLLLGYSYKNERYLPAYIKVSDIINGKTGQGWNFSQIKGFSNKEECLEFLKLEADKYIEKIL